METDKIVIVTGASQGIGRGIVEAFIAEGYRVILADINETEAKVVAESLGERAMAIFCDVSNEISIQNLFSKVKEVFGRVDIVVNNAGVFPFVKLNDMSTEDFNKVISVNLTGAFLVAKEAAKIMPEGGRIINISSIAASVSFRGLAHYSASKAGLDGLTRGLALELAPMNITVNGVAPGAIDTPGAREGTHSAESPVSPTIPLGRQGTPADIAGIVTFLASERAGYITGQTIVVDGGWTIV